jgi:acetyl-CoA carboxylase biotin carboxylase subunit
MTIARVLIANRGEIAVRIIRACQGMGIETVLAVSEADRNSLPAGIADRTICIGPPQSDKSYLNIGALITAALGTDCDAQHPGYGFLAESAALAETCTTEGITFVGPPAAQIRQMGNKLEARALARQMGVPTLPGSERVHTPTEAAAAAERIGLPAVTKAAAGGGGRGMKIMSGREDIQPMFESASAEARAAFGDGTIYLERYIPNARHIEVQLLGDRFGNVIHVGERDCSLQRRHQKIIEEAPAPAISEELRQQIRQTAVQLGRNIGYENAGTTEFIVDQDTGTFFFLEMNTRIQVEHPVTEMITGIDLVQEQFRVADGESLRFGQSDIMFRGHAIECRINAEVPRENFRPSPGLITSWQTPKGPNIRLDTHCFTGYKVPIFYDSMLGKLIVYASDRSEAIQRMSRALAQFAIAGIGTTLEFLQFAINYPDFVAGRVNTQLVEKIIAGMAEAGPQRGP